MAMIECGKHGLQHVAFTSTYVHSLVLTRKPIDEEVFPVKIYLDVFDGYAHCWSTLRLINDLGVSYRTEAGFIVIDGLGEEKSLEVYDSAAPAPVCIVCYKEFEQQNGLSFP